MKAIALLLLSVLLVSSACNKNKDNWDITVNGYMRQKGDSSLYKNTQFVIYLEKENSVFNPSKQGDDKVYHFSTDENGYFSVTYSNPPGYKGARFCRPDNAERDCGASLSLPQNRTYPYAHNFGDFYF